MVTWHYSGTNSPVTRAQLQTSFHEEAKRLRSEGLKGALEEMERLQKVNKEIARAAEVIVQISKTLE